MIVQVRVTKTLDTSFAQLAAANRQGGIEKLLGRNGADDKPSAQAAQVAKPSKGEELRKAINEQKRQDSQWTYGDGDVGIVFMDNAPTKFACEWSSREDWATKALLDDYNWGQYKPEKRPAPTPAQKATLERFQWTDPVKPRDCDLIIQNLEDSHGLFCHEALNGTSVWDFAVIAKNYATHIKRPIGWHFDGRISLSTIRERHAWFKDYDVTFFDKGEYVGIAVRQFAESLTSQSKAERQA